MNQPQSNRGVPYLDEYYQKLADIFGIFWQFHKERVESGNIAFATQRDYDTDSLLPFDPMRNINEW